jgi:hypothetical protein
LDSRKLIKDEAAMWDHSSRLKKMRLHVRLPQAEVKRRGFP